MARRGGLGQRGIDLLISGTPDRPEKEEKTEKRRPTGKNVQEKPGKAKGNKNSEDYAAGSKDAKVRKNSKTDSLKSEADAGRISLTDVDAQPGYERIQAGAVSDERLISDGDKASDIEWQDKDADPEAVKNPEAAGTAGKNEPLMIPINEIEPNREQPRKNFDEDSLQELSDSIKTYGVIEPLIVLKKDDYYELIAGERRWRAAKLAGIKELPVIIKDYTGKEAMEISLIENIQRQNLNPIEEANAYRRLMDEYQLRQDELAERVSKSRAAIANSMRLLKLDQRVQDMVVSGMISSGHARALLAIEDPSLQYTTAQQVFDERLSVRDVEKLVKKLLTRPAEPKPSPISEALKVIYENMEEQMKTSLGTKVTIASRTPEKGKIEIEYYSKDELERIFDVIRVTPGKEN